MVQPMEVLLHLCQVEEGTIVASAFFLESKVAVDILAEKIWSREVLDIVL